MERTLWSEAEKVLADTGNLIPIKNTAIVHYVFANFKIVLYYILVSAVEHPILPLPKISRLQMGDYLCVASNGVMPSASKKIRVSVQCKHAKIQFTLIHNLGQRQKSLQRT